MGSNVSASYTGCIDRQTDRSDVFAFDVPADHVIEAKLTMEDAANDFDLFIEDSNGTELNSSEGIDITEFTTTLGHLKKARLEPTLSTLVLTAVKATILLKSGQITLYQCLTLYLKKLQVPKVRAQEIRYRRY